MSHESSLIIFREYRNLEVKVCTVTRDFSKLNGYSLFVRKRAVLSIHIKIHVSITLSVMLQFKTSVCLLFEVILR